VHTRRHVYIHEQTQMSRCIDVSEHHVHELRIRVATLNYAIREVLTSSAFILDFSLEKYESSRVS